MAAGERFDASSDAGPVSRRDDSSGHAKPFLGVQFECCQMYRRIYRNAASTAYEGRCPRCGALVSVPIGDGGSSSRFFRAG